MMMKRATLAVAFLLCVVTMLGQNGAESQNKRFWDAGALTWDDFRVEPRFAALSRDSYLSWRITPRVGASVISAVPQKGPNADVTRSSIHAIGPSAGMQVEYKISRRLQLFPAAGGGYRYTENTIGCRFDATRILSHSQSAGGWWYNVSFVWGGPTLVPKR